MQPEVKNPRLRPLNFRHVNLILLTRKQRNSNGYTYDFGTQPINKNSSNVVRPKGKPEVKNTSWRPITGNIHRSMTSHSNCTIPVVLSDSKTYVELLELCYYPVHKLRYAYLKFVDAIFDFPLAVSSCMPLFILDSWTPKT